MLEIICTASGDRADAPSAEHALVAAAQLVTDHVDADGGSYYRSPKRVRATLIITENGTYNGTLTGLARAGYRGPLA